VVKRFRPAEYPDWRYPLRVAAALRARGWPTPEPVEEPLIHNAEVWVLYHRLPGRPMPTDEPRARGRLLAELHFAATETGIVDQREGFRDPAEIVGDPALDSLLRLHERTSPEAGHLLRACRDEAAQWFTDNPAPAVPRSVIHGDFAPWNLLFDNGRLTGLVDFEAAHHTFQVGDFALSWRGYQDDVLRGYDEVRALSDDEWHLIQPVYRAWILMGVRGALEAGPAPDLDWELQHLRKHSPLVTAKTAGMRPHTGGFTGGFIGKRPPFA
jgi:Ser/Thr protein kinase RdoA (MazF antagonist)